MLEDILKQIRAMLQNQLPGKLDQIELERADGATLEDIQSFLVQGGGDNTTLRLDSRTKYPNVTIMGEATSASNALSRRRELWHRISVWVINRQVSPDSELAHTKLWRYVEAVERVLASDPTLGGKALDSVVVSHEYTLKGREEFVKGAILTMGVLERPSTSNY
ncbi:MAG TPA: hypothetical protein ACFYD1_07740 [Candidatus Hypogeohydataceae bacterium YC38]|nr:hypothetical protein [Candidatus Brocadiales bacterium]